MMIDDYAARVAWKFSEYGDQEYPGLIEASFMVLLGKAAALVLRAVMASIALLRRIWDAFVPAAGGCEVPSRLAGYRFAQLVISARSRDRLTSRRTTGPPRVPAMIGT